MASLQKQSFLGGFLMNRPEKSFSLFALLLPFAVSILVLCITAGYLIYRIADERAYRERWKDYHDCGLG